MSVNRGDWNLQQAIGNVPTDGQDPLDSFNLETDFNFGFKMPSSPLLPVADSNQLSSPSPAMFNSSMNPSGAYPSKCY